MDISSIEPGLDFTEAISSALAGCHAVIVLIGSRWLTASNRHGDRRLDDPEDLVRREIEAALSGILRVIPVLVQGAAMPTADEVPPALSLLLRRHAFELTDRHWHSDIAAMIGLLRSVLPGHEGEDRSRVEDPDSIPKPWPSP